MVRDLLLHTVELGEVFLSIGRELVALSRIITVGEVRGERVDSALKCFAERSSALERVAFGLDALLPVGFIFLRLALLAVVRGLLCVIRRLLVFFARCLGRRCGRSGRCGRRTRRRWYRWRRFRTETIVRVDLPALRTLS